MTPGGEDLVLEGPTSDEDWVAIFHEVQRTWPNAVIERLESGEALIFRDQQASEREFEADEVPHGFLHVLVGPNCLTVVVDDEEGEARSLGIAVFESVRASRG